jgi:hypothetical protein
MPLKKFKKKNPEFIKAIQFTQESVDEIGYILKRIVKNSFWTLGSVATNDISVFVITNGEWKDRIEIEQGDWLVLKDGKVSKMTTDDILTNWEVVIPSENLEED